MALVVKKDEPFDPVNIALLGFWTVVPRADSLADLIEKFGSGGVVGAVTAALRSNRFLFSGYTLALSMLSPPVADAVQSSGSTEPMTWFKPFLY